MRDDPKINHGLASLTGKEPSKRDDAWKLEFLVTANSPPIDHVQACHCTGPKNGDPVCPCQMRSVQIVGGRYVQTIDLGPVK